MPLNVPKFMQRRPTGRRRSTSVRWVWAGLAGGTLACWNYRHYYYHYSSWGPRLQEKKTVSLTTTRRQRQHSLQRFLPTPLQIQSDSSSSSLYSSHELLIPTPNHREKATSFKATSFKPRGKRSYDRDNDKNNNQQRLQSHWTPESNENRAITSSTKVSFHNNNTSLPFRSASDVRMVLVHVGKSGGQSLYGPLGIIGITRHKLPCLMQQQHHDKKVDVLEHCTTTTKQPGHSKFSSSLLRQRIMGHVHVGSVRYRPAEKTWLQQHTTLWLFTVRDPVDRIVSAFRYHHHQVFGGQPPLGRAMYDADHVGARIYIDCFPTVQALASAVHPAARNSSCRNMGLQLLAGTFVTQPCLHFKWNYAKYASMVWTNRSQSVAVVRTRSQWQDVWRLEQQLGGDASMFDAATSPQEKFTHGSESYILQSGVNEKGSFALCCGLFRDLQVYHDVILAAVNLNEMEKQSTLVETMQRCGVPDVKSLSWGTLVSWSWKTWHEKSCTHQ